MKARANESMPRAAEPPISRPNERDRLRRRLLELILKNEARRKAKPK